MLPQPAPGGQHEQLACDGGKTQGVTFLCSWVTRLRCRARAPDCLLREFLNFEFGLVGSHYAGERGGCAIAE